MKIVRINHNRCGDYAGTTVVWVRDDMTEEELDERVQAAEREYLASLQEFKEIEKPEIMIPSHQPNWEKNRDRNVGEVLDEHAEKKEKAAAYHKARQAALKRFDHYLEQQEGIQNFWEAEWSMEAEIYWGHRHGTTIEYGDTAWPKFTLLEPGRLTVPSDTKVVRTEETEEWL